MRSGLRILAAAAALLLAGCGDPPQESGRPAAGDRGGAALNVILISIDTTRADALGCYGNASVRTPHIDRLAAEGTRFAQCISNAPVTLPAHASMLTGAYQFVHGARSNGTFQVAPENTTLAELFKQHDYDTAAEVAASVLGRLYGLDQGFDHYGDLLDADRDDRVDTTYHVERSAATITDRGIEFLRARTGRPFFLFLHYFDPHEPYDPPEPYRSRYSPYLGEVAYVDEHIGRLMDALRQSDLADRTLVILTSDHGEGLGQHDEPTHAYFLYDSTLHVPLIMWGPGRVPAGRVAEQQVRLVDLASTVVDLLGWEPTAEMQGASLVSLLEGGDAAWPEAGYADTYYPAVVFGLAQLRCLRTNAWKYVHAPTPELYDLRSDPGELTNLAAAQPERVAAMRAQLRTLIASSPPRPAAGGGRIRMDDAQRRKLEALGYLGGGEAEDVIGADEDELDNFDATAPELKDRIDVLRLNNDGARQTSQGRWAEAVRSFQGVLELAPESGSANIELANAYAQLQQLELALQHYRRAAELQPNDALPLYSIGEILAFQEDYAAAEAALVRAIEIDPAWTAPYAELGRVLMRQKRYADAAAILEQAVGVADYDQAIRVRFARALQAAGQTEAAEEQLRTACARDPELASARLWLGLLLIQTQRDAEGIELLRTAQRLAPRDVRPADNLARYHMLREEFDEAVPYFRKAAELAPRQPLRLHNLGTCLRQAGRADEALPEYVRALEMNPGLPDTFRALLETYRELDRGAEGARACERVLEKQPEDDRIYVIAADYLDAEGDPAAGLAAVRAGLAVRPDAPRLLAACAWRLATAEDATRRAPQEALALALRAVELSPEADPQVLRVLAYGYAASERWTEAIETIERAQAVAGGQAGISVEALEADLARFRSRAASSP